MKRQMVLGILFAAGALTLTVNALQQPQAGASGQPAPRVVEVDKLKDNLFMMRGGDHVSGNVEFPATVEVVTHANTAKNMQEMRSPSGITPAPGTPANIFKDNNGRGLPKRTFTDNMKIGKGADEIELHYFGRGHTNGDAWVVFPALRVMHAGDIFSGKNIPLLDAVNGGSGVEIGKTLAKAAKSVKNADSIITGHSTVMTMADLREYAQFNDDFANAVREAKKKGGTVDEFVKTWKIPAQYKGYAAPAEARLLSNARIVWDEVK